MQRVISTFGLDGASHSLCWVANRRPGGPVARGESASVRAAVESFRKGGSLRGSFRPRVYALALTEDDYPLLQPPSSAGPSA